MNPIGAGLGLKPEHFEQARDCTAAGLWYEIHPENYLVDGGPRLRWLDAIRARHPLSLHGVSLSLAGEAPPDPAHLKRLAALACRLEPVLVSEHLAWSSWDGQYFPDLLPVPRTTASLQRIVAHIGQVQDTLRRPLSIENPSHYLSLEAHAWSETDFLREIAQRSGCGLLLDLNNVFVSASNLGYSAQAYVDAFPWTAVTEIHLAGHSLDEGGSGLLVDAHASAVSEAVWSLYARAIQHHGARPTLIERDDQLPAFEALICERDRAQALLPQVRVAA